MARAVHSLAITPDELVMTGLGIQAWVLTLLGIRSAFAHKEIAMALEIIHALGNSYRLASSGVISSVAYGRLATIFCRAAVVGLLKNLVPRQNANPHPHRYESTWRSIANRSYERWSPRNSHHPDAAAGAGWWSFSGCVLPAGRAWK